MSLELVYLSLGWSTSCTAGIVGVALGVGNLEAGLDPLLLLGLKTSDVGGLTETRKKKLEIARQCIPRNKHLNIQEYSNIALLTMMERSSAFKRGDKGNNIP